MGHCVVYVVDPDAGENADAGDVTVLRVFGPGQLRQLGFWAQTLRISRAVENQSIRRFGLSVAVLNPSRNR
jgi:hypothetical protein